MQQFRPSIGYSWLWASGVAFISLALMIFLRWRLPLEVTIAQWQPFASVSSSPVFRLDFISWPYALSLAALLLAVLLTDSARLQTEASPRTWIVTLLVAGMGLLAVLSGNPLALVLTWTALDLLELVVVLSTAAGRRMSESTITAFSVRVAGTLLVIAALLYSRSLGIEFSLAPIPQEMAVLMLLAAGMRLGVLPLNLPYTREVYAWRGLGTMVGMVGPASSLVVLGRMPVDAIPVEWRSPLIVLSTLAALYGASMWLASRSGGRPYWVISLAGLAIASVLRGNPQASIAWGLTLILIGSVISLFTAVRRQMMFVPLLGLLGIAGLPFTPTASGWQGIIGLPFDIYNPLFMLAVLLLLWGFLRHVFQPRDFLEPMERWVHSVHPAGLLVLIITQWAVLIANWRTIFVPGVWWASVPVALIALVGATVYYFNRERLMTESYREGWFNVFASRLGGALAVFFRLNWLYRFIGWLYQGLQGAVHLLTAMFEGDGGILWAMVMLAVLISIITIGGSP